MTASTRDLIADIRRDARDARSRAATLRTSQATRADWLRTAADLDAAADLLAEED